MPAYIDEIQKIAEARERERPGPLAAAGLIAGGTLAGSLSARLLASALARRGISPTVRSSLDYILPALTAGAIGAGLARDREVAGD